MRPETNALAPPPVAVVRGTDPHGAGAERRRASRALWQACEALLSAPADPRALDRALAGLRQAFDCDGVALHARGPDGEIEPWHACGEWRSAPGDLRDCMTVPLLCGAERLGILDLRARAGQRWRPAQFGLVRAASGALGAALGARLELERLRRRPGRDRVTGLPDAKAFQERLAEELARVRAHGPALAVALLEIDHFDALRARHGREIADAVLAEAALVLKLALRDGDVLARLAGARFAVALPETDTVPALRCAERVRRAVEDHRFARVGNLSATAGLAASPREGLEAVELMEKVERALALARKAGRRRVAAAPTALTQ
ncbi:MAG: GGDEF domain-containing protein [Candidatus Eisenbacteria bacterium]|nr:GGDEF domain-containing protein [Candidatus Eisenbacteria bacterium]